MAGRRKRPPALSSTFGSTENGAPLPEGFVAQCEDWGGVKGRITPSTGSREGTPVRRIQPTPSEKDGLIEASCTPASEVDSKPSSAHYTPASLPAGATSSTEYFEVKSLDELLFLERLGQGASSVVEKHKHKATGFQLAVKILNAADKAEKTRQSILVELRTFASASHDGERRNPHIVKFFGSFFIGPALHIMLEYMDGGALSGILARRGSLAESLLQNIAAQVLDGLQHLHCKMKVIHGDMKPANILLNTSGIVKITDFGVSSEMDDDVSIQSKITFVGTVHYMSPERIEGEPYRFNSDLWSLGLILLECCIGRHPYTHESDGAVGPTFWQLQQRIREQKPPVLSDGLGYSAELQDLIALMLKKNPEQRPSVLHVAKHSYVVEPTPAQILELAQWIKESIPLPVTDQAKAIERSPVRVQPDLQVATHVEADARAKGWVDQTGRWDQNPFGSFKFPSMVPVESTGGFSDVSRGPRMPDGPPPQHVWRMKSLPEPRMPSGPPPKFTGRRLHVPH